MSERVRIFQSALNGVRYADGAPMTFQEYRALTEKEQMALHAKCRK